MKKVKKMTVRERVLRTILRHRKAGFHMIDVHHIHTDGVSYISGDRRLRTLREDGVVKCEYRIKPRKQYDFKKTSAVSIRKELRKLEKERGVK